MKRLLTRGAWHAGILVFAAAIGLGLFASRGDDPREAEADGPTAIMGLNNTLCATLGIAFGGIPATTAVVGCLAWSGQNDFQGYVRCLLGSDINHDGVRDATDCLDPADFEDGLVRPTPAQMAVVDLDKNQAQIGNKFHVAVFVPDDSPVRFITTGGEFTSSNDDEFFCDNSAEDPDCDGLAGTIGDGVVVATIDVDDEEDLGTHKVTAIQEGIGYPMEWTLTGAPEQIVLTTLFAKTTIQTGATDPTPAGEEADETDCNFSGSVTGVLAANNQAEKAIIVAKALDDDDTEIAGALLIWDALFVDDDANITEAELFSTEFPEGGVALPTTPTLDTGAIGLAFPQFVCGRDEPGTLTVTAKFAGATDIGADFNTFSDKDEEASIDIEVVGPAETMTLAADPPAIVCDGVATSKVTATVKRADGGNVANGLDANFSVSVLGTASPLVANTTDGVASTTVTPLRAGAGTGVPVIVRAGDVEGLILVQCNDAAPAAPGAAPPPTTGGAGGPGGVITGPDTGTGGDFAGRGALPVWPAVALFIGAMGLIGARYGVSRR